MRGLHVEGLRVRSLDVDRKEVTWETRGSTDPRDFTFRVYRSESPGGPFEAVSPAFEDRYIFVDSRQPAGDPSRKLWYRIRLTHKASGDVEDSGPASHEAEPDVVAAYVRRQEQVLFTQAIGRRCWLFKRRSFGPRCPSCWDSMAHKRTRANCLDCFQTGFLRGYHNPIEVWVQIDPSTVQHRNNAQQIDREAHTTARMTFYPNVNPKDVLVEAENRRWRVMAVTPSERLRATIKQELTLREIQPTDIEYRLPVNTERALRDIQPSPPRMFTNPTGLHNQVAEAVPDVFANYSTYPEDPKSE